MTRLAGAIHACPRSRLNFSECWISEGVIPGQSDGTPTVSFFEFERSFWEQRGRSNVLLVRYRDLKADTIGEMRRIAQFLGLNVPEER